MIVPEDEPLVPDRSAVGKAEERWDRLARILPPRLWSVDQSGELAKRNELIHVVDGTLKAHLKAGPREPSVGPEPSPEQARQLVPR